MLAEALALFVLTLPPIPASMPDPVPPVNRTALKWALTGYGVASAVDRATTTACVAQGTCREVGAMRWANGHPGAFAATGAAVDLGMGWLLLSWGKTHPKAATWAAVALTAFKIGIVVRNSRQLR